MRDVVAHMRIVDGALRLGLPGVVCTLVIGEYSDDVDVIDVLEYIFCWVDKLAAKNKVQTLVHMILRWGRWHANRSRRRVKSGRTWLCQRADYVAMNADAAGDNTGGLPCRAVERQRLTFAICHDGAGLGYD